MRILIYKIKNRIKQVRNILRWIPILWKDRDWDYYHVYEILKQKLINTEAYLRAEGLHLYNNEDADSIKKAIEMIEKVQTEYFLDQYLSEAKTWTTKGIEQATKDHDKARKELFDYLSNNIEKWWD